MNKCKSCGRMLKADDSGEKFCKNCVDESGKLRSYDEVASNLAQYLRETQGLDERASNNAAKAIVSSQPVWEKKQGVYFEGDMKMKRRTIVAMSVIIALLALTLGGSFLYGRINTKEIKPFHKDKNHLVTREVDNHSVYELDIPGFQMCPVVVDASKEEFSDAILFSSQKYKGSVNDGSCLYGYNIDGNYGKKIGTNGDPAYVFQVIDDYYILQFAQNEDERFGFISNLNWQMNQTHSCYDSISLSYPNDTYGYSLSFPNYSPLHLRPNQLEYFSYPQKNGDNIIWCEEGQATKNRILYLEKLKTSHTEIISESISPISKPILTKDYIIWEDVRDSKNDKFSILYYDLNTGEERVIDNGDKDKYLSSANNKYAVYVSLNDTSQKVDINVFDLKEGVLAHSITDNKIPLEDDRQYLNPNPVVKISNDEKVSTVTWYASDTGSGKVITKFLRVGIDEKPQILEINSNAKYHWSLHVSGNYIISCILDISGERKVSYYLSDIADNKSVKLDDGYYTGFSRPFSNTHDITTNIQNDYVFWINPNKKQDKHNICWARLSEIFPGEELAGAIGE